MSGKVEKVKMKNPLNADLIVHFGRGYPLLKSDLMFTPAVSSNIH